MNKQEGTGSSSVKKVEMEYRTTYIPTDISCCCNYSRIRILLVVVKHFIAVATTLPLDLLT